MSGATQPVSQAGIGCVILAAGAGTRYGGPKAAAMFPSGARFVDVVARRTHDAGIATIVAVMHPEVAAPPGVRAVTNPNPASEQIVSIQLGLAQLLNSPLRGAFIWPVDHPHVSSDTVAAILDVVRSKNPLIARPVYQGQHGHPVYFSRDVWRDLVTAQHGGARTVVHSHAAAVVDVPVEDAGVLRNVDSRDD
jgi:CTP:molybdopterin cytidylyltransferase MocA